MLSEVVQALDPYKQARVCVSEMTVNNFMVALKMYPLNTF